MKFDFGCHANRCLFSNHCLEAHLVGLDGAQPDYQDCLAQPTTVLVTFGMVQVATPQRQTTLQEGESLRLPPKTPFHIHADPSADLMLLMGTRASPTNATATTTNGRAQVLLPASPRSVKLAPLHPGLNPPQPKARTRTASFHNS